MVDQSWGTGIWERAWGKVTNTRPGPSVTTVCGAKEYFMFNIEEMATRVSRNVYHSLANVKLLYRFRRVVDKISNQKVFPFAVPKCTKNVLQRSL